MELSSSLSSASALVPGSPSSAAGEGAGAALGAHAAPAVVAGGLMAGPWAGMHSSSSTKKIAGSQAAPAASWWPRKAGARSAAPGLSKSSSSSCALNAECSIPRESSSSWWKKDKGLQAAGVLLGGAASRTGPKPQPPALWVQAPKGGSGG